MYELKGCVAIVTGGSRGLGRETALCLAQNGADVVVNYHHAADKATSICEQIRSLGRRCIAVKADVSQKDDVDALVDRAMKEFGRLDILVNNAGVLTQFDIFSLELEEWERVMRINLTSVFLTCKRAAPIMREQNYGRIISISSISGQQGCLVFGQVHYGASKAGILGFSKTLARTMAPYHTTVNVVAPGMHLTDTLTEVWGDDPRPSCLDRVPMGALGTARDVAAAVAFLASREAGYITGATIDVNGGILMR